MLAIRFLFWINDIWENFSYDWLLDYGVFYYADVLFTEKTIFEKLL